MHTKWYGLIGKLPVPCKDMLEAVASLEGDHRIALTETEFHQISTVFLGLDHSHHPRGRPVLFETMVSERFDDSSVDFQTSGIIARYSTWDEAEKGHNKVVAEVKSNEANAEKVVSKHNSASRTTP